MFDLFVNGKFVKRYATLRGVRIAYGQYLRKIERGEIAVTVPEHVDFLKFQKVS